MSHSIFIIAFLVIFGIAVFTILFKTVSNILLSFKAGTKSTNRKHNQRRTYNHSFTTESNDDFIRQAEMMHDIARQSHERMHNSFMDNSISISNDFMNNMNMHNMM